MTIELTVLGSSGMFATPQRASSGYLVEYGDTRLWMDAGAGSWRNLMRHVDYRTLDGVLLSHRHPDHTTDVFQAFHARQYGGREPLPPIPLWAPAETLERLRAFAAEIEQSFDLRTVAAGGTLEVGAATFEFVAMVHPVETVGARITLDGSVLAYSADTGPDADFEALAGGADVFVCEATLQDADEPWPGHTSASDAGRLAAGLGVGRLVLTHLPPGRDLEASLKQAQRTPGDMAIELAQDHRRLRIG